MIFSLYKTQAFTRREALLILFSIILMDILTKLIALNFLPFQKDVFVIGRVLSFYLTFNQDSSGTQVGYILQGESNKNMILMLSAWGGLILAGYILYIRKIKIRTIYKWLIGIALYVSVTVILQMANPYFTGVYVSNWVASVVSKISGILIYTAFLVSIPQKSLQILILVIISGGLANLINHFYYPFYIIDFIHIKDSEQILGIGIFNWADLAFEIGFWGAIINLLFIIFKFVYNLAKKFFSPSS